TDFEKPEYEPSPKISWWQRPIVWQPAFAAFAVLLLLGGRGAWRYAQTDYLINQATALLQKEHRIFFQDVRLSGGYGSSGPETTMGSGEEKEETYLDRAKAQVEKAIANGATSVAAKQLLIQISVMNQDYARADVLVRELEPLAKKSPTLANDLGVYYFQRQAWRKAEEYFAAARAGDPKLSEAYFNLALAQAQLGKKSEALAVIQEYLVLETDEGWKLAAQTLKQKLQTAQE
ncbi:MAG: hypothetical protein AAB354_10135, partial [candidate division KSB1 bacterium]